MTDAEIIKALKCCSNDDNEVCVNNCPLYKTEECCEELPELALDLIRRQQAEIEELKNKPPFALMKYSKKDLEAIVAKKFEDIEIDINKVISEAVREFAVELLYNLDVDIETYANAGHGLNVYGWLKGYLVNKEVINAEANPV